MPKAEKGSVKDIAKRIKAKGLQKLKFYCQVCEKQCRDANGFKCHIQSESHLRQMKIFSENATGIMDSYSKEFEKVFMDTLRMRHGTTRMMANRVYNEVIQDKQHVHMNSTMWASLSDFCKYLGRTGKCVVEETERGWFITYIERDVAKLQREEALQRRLQAEQEAEKAALERMEHLRREQAELASAKREQVTNLERRGDGNEAMVKVELQTASNKPKRKTPATVALGFGDDDDNDDNDEKEKNDEKHNMAGDKEVRTNQVADPNELLEQGKRKALEQPADRKRQAQQKEQARNSKLKKHKSDNSKDATHQQEKKEESWLYKGIVVRVVNQQLAQGRYFRRKAVIDRLVSPYTAELTILEPKEGQGDSITGDVLEMDQADLETVVPKQTGVKVRLVKGPFRGKKAKLKHLDKTQYTAQLKLDEDYLDDVDFSDFAQMA